MSDKNKIDVKVTDAEEKPEAPVKAEADDKDEAQQEAQPEEELSEEEKLSLRVAELEDRLLRTAADFENYKKRVARQYDSMVQSANERILGELLEIVDNLERAVEHGNTGTDVDALQKGMKLIHDQTVSLLGRYNVTPIEAVGKPFDPNLHEAVMSVESTEYAEGTVALEMNKGYKCGERVLRHSKVGVSKGIGGDDAEDKEGAKEPEEPEE